MECHPSRNSAWARTIVLMILKHVDWLATALILVGLLFSYALPPSFDRSLLGSLRGQQSMGECLGQSLQPGVKLRISHNRIKIGDACLVPYNLRRLLSMTESGLAKLKSRHSHWSYSMGLH